MLESAANVYLKNFHNAWKRVQWNLLTFDESRCFTSVQMKKKKKNDRYIVPGVFNYLGWQKLYGLHKIFDIGLCPALLLRIP